eukprot:TRINITY_DN102150_c0_g1_i1.p1 TRINITY_DN102150_c0_g1~~TRINITY_DN102150_c0_g1_i1.p1  ORF type:complete len:225 (-),score=24.48 TRINITY_DN102150_c0_g1_i1:99-773(-)
MNEDEKRIAAVKARRSAKRTECLESYRSSIQAGRHFIGSIPPPPLSARATTGWQARESLTSCASAGWRRTPRGELSSSLQGDAGTLPGMISKPRPVSRGSCLNDPGYSRWLFFGGFEVPPQTPEAKSMRFQSRMDGLQAEIEGVLADELARCCPHGAPPRCIRCTFDHVTGKGPTGALVEFATVVEAKNALNACRAAMQTASKKPWWRLCGFARTPGDERMPNP